MSGNLDSSRDLVKICFRGSISWSEHSLITLGCRSSGPCDFDGFNFKIAFLMLSAVISIVDNVSIKSLSGNSGNGPGPSVSKTLAKYLFNSSAFVYCHLLVSHKVVSIDSS